MTTTTTTTAVLINVGYVKKAPGLVMLLQIVLGIIAVAIVGHYIKWYSNSSYDYMVPELFFLLVVSACLITTSVLFMSCLCSIATASILPKTLFEVMYHIVALLLTTAGGIWYMVFLNRRERQGYNEDFEPRIAAASMGLVMAFLYLVASYYSYRAYKRG